jgi:hypothetical protein
MTIEPSELQLPTASKSGKKTKSMVMILTIVLIILIFGVASGIREEAQYPHTKQAPAYIYTRAYCEPKVLGLAAHGEIAGAEGVNGAMYECTHLVSPYSIYSEAHT